MPATISSIAKQYADAKAVCPEAILLFHMGDFYEAYYEDARRLANVLGVGPIDWQDNGDSVAVPERHLEVCLRKLIAAGHRAAICEQVPDKVIQPTVSKDYGSREITRMVTPSAIETFNDFQLRNDPPRKPPLRFANSDHGRQTRLLDGMDCLPGQLDLFDTLK